MPSGPAPIDPDRPDPDCEPVCGCVVPGAESVVGAPLAVKAYLDHSPALPTRVEREAVGLRDRGTGRPTKRERRDIDRLSGRR